MSARIAFQGELGAYGHQACREARPDMEPLPCPTFEDAVEAVRKGDAALGMIAVENSIYVKGPGSLGIGATGNYRAEAVQGVVRYEWSQDSIDRGQVSGEPTDPLLRLFELTGVRSGTVRITVLALDASNTILAVGTRTISVGR